MRRGFCEEVVKELRAEEQVGVNQVKGIGRGVLGGECACGKARVGESLVCRGPEKAAGTSEWHPTQNSRM